MSFNKKEIIDRRMFLKLLFAGAVSLGELSLIGCDEKKENTHVSTETNLDEEIENQVTKLYYDWARLSRLRDYEGMKKLVFPRSNFDGMTDMCNSQWGKGTELCYRFDDVKIDYTEKIPPEAFVVGKWEMYQDIEEVYNGEFFSTSQPLDGDFYRSKWKLDNMRLL